MNVALPPTRTLGVAGAVAIVLAVAIAGGWYWYDTQQRRVAAAYAEVLTRVYAAQSPQAPADERARAQQALEQILAQHPSAGPVAEAAYELGNLRYAARQWAPARGAYEIAAARGTSPTRPRRTPRSRPPACARLLLRDGRSGNPAAVLDRALQRAA